VDMFATDRPETRSRVADHGQRERRVTRRPSPQVRRQPRRARLMSYATEAAQQADALCVVRRELGKGQW
jgi:hypothetical protein